jgi:peptidoglycan/LPS O-acetylase OafA/YrhL
LYLSHKAVLHLVNQAFAPHLDGHPAAAFVVYTLAIVAAGAALYYGIERPFLRLRDRTTARTAAAAIDRPAAATRLPSTPDL